MVVTTSAVFAALLFTQTFPAVTRSSGLVANCTTLTVDGPVPSVGTQFNIRFNCGPGVAAVSAPTSTVVTVTPTFTLPAGYLFLGTVPPTSDVSNCSQLTSGQPVGMSGSSDYCAAVDATTVQLATFDVSWAA